MGVSTLPPRRRPHWGVGRDRYTSAPAKAASMNFLSGAWRACEHRSMLLFGAEQAPRDSVTGGATSPVVTRRLLGSQPGGRGSGGPPLEVQPEGGQTPGGPPALYPAPNGASHPRPQPITAGPLWGQPLVGYPPKSYHVRK